MQYYANIMLVDISNHGAKFHENIDLQSVEVAKYNKALNIAP